MFDFFKYFFFTERNYKNAIFAQIILYFPRVINMTPIEEIYIIIYFIIISEKGGTLYTVISCP